MILSGTLPAQDVSRHYDVMSGDKTVGIVHARKYVEGESTRYDVISEVTMSLIFKVHVSYKVSAVYRYNALQASTATIYLNGSVKNQIDVIRRNGYYDVVIDGAMSRIDGNITASSATLYFEKPPLPSQVFSETSGILKPLTTMADGRLLLQDPNRDSEINRYLYHGDNLLKTIDIERFLFPSLVLHHVRDSRL